MTEQTDLAVGRADVLIDRATRIACPGHRSGVRLLAWIAMFAICCLMLWTLGGVAAHAEDPKAAARAIGQAGAAAAGAIARDASKAGAVPGYRCDTADACLNPTLGRVAVPADRGFRGRVAALLRRLAEAVRTDTAPPADALGLVNLTTLPVYRVINAAAAYRGAVIDQEIDALAEAVALDVLQVWISDLHRAIEERAGTLDIADGEQLSEASRRYSTATGESEAASLDESVSANLTRMRRFEERASLARQESESWSEQAAQVRTQAQAIDRELGQPFFVWLSEREGADGRPIGAGAAVRIATPQTPEESETLREHAAAFVAERFPRPDGPDPATVGGEAEYGTARDTLSDSYARETAAAYGGWAEGVRDRAYVADAPIPGVVEAGALGARAETKADMTVKGGRARGAGRHDP